MNIHLIQPASVCNTTQIKSDHHPITHRSINPRPPHCKEFHSVNNFSHCMRCRSLANYKVWNNPTTECALAPSAIKGRRKGASSAGGAGPRHLQNAHPEYINGLPRSFCALYGWTRKVYVWPIPVITARGRHCLAGEGRDVQTSPSICAWRHFVDDGNASAREKSARCTRLINEPMINGPALKEMEWSVCVYIMLSARYWSFFSCGRRFLCWGIFEIWGVRGLYREVEL